MGLLKKENLLETMLSEVLKLLKVLKILFYRSTFLKLEIQYKTGLRFPFNLGWHSIQLDIVC